MGDEAIGPFYFPGQVWSISMSGHRPSLLFSLFLSVLRGVTWRVPNVRESNEGSLWGNGNWSG